MQNDENVNNVGNVLGKKKKMKLKLKTKSRFVMVHYTKRKKKTYVKRILTKIYFIVHIPWSTTS